MSQLRIGVVKQASQLNAHAWVELHGQPLGDSSPELAKFTVLKPYQGIGDDPPDDSSQTHLSSPQ